MEKLLANYHTHTFRCGHASGEDRDYIENAIRAGIRILGFSDHSPMLFPSGHYSSFRVQPEFARDYFDSISRLRDEYKNDIEIHIGVEVEYFPSSFESYLSYIGQFPCEYFICGQHFVWDEENGIHSFSATDDESKLSQYFDNLIMAAESGRFLYIAHPDIFRFTGSDEVYVKHARRFIEAAKKCDIPLEINRLGLEDGRHYPKDAFWRECAKYGNRVIIGVDAHNPEALSDLAVHRRCIDYAEERGLNLIKDNIL